jgi:pilus assembly protein CpaB
MRSKSIILLALALGCGLVASIGVSQLMESRGPSADAGDRQAVFVAMTDISANEEMTAQNVKLEEWPKNIIPAGALTKLEEVEGKRCRVKLYAGEPILSSKLLGASEKVGAAKDIPPGYRVAHVKVDPQTGSSNLILPGDRVDILVFRQQSTNLNATAAKIVLQDIKVFAVDTHTETEFSQNKNDQTEPISARTIALLVTPKQAELLHAASEMGGALRLVLRNPDDNAVITSPGATIGDVFGQGGHSNRTAEEGEDKESSSLTAWINDEPPKPTKKAPAFPPAPASRKMMVIMGSQLTQVEIPADGKPPLNQPTAGAGSASLPPDFGGKGVQQGPDDVPLPPAEDDAGETSEETKPGE